MCGVKNLPYCVSEGLVSKACAFQLVTSPCQKDLHAASAALSRTAVAWCCHCNHFSHDLAVDATLTQYPSSQNLVVRCPQGVSQRRRAHARSAPGSASAVAATS